MAWPWPSHGPSKSPKNAKNVQNCKNPKYGFVGRGFVGPDAWTPQHRRFPARSGLDLEIRSGGPPGGASSAAERRILPGPGRNWRQSEASPRPPGGGRPGRKNCDFGFWPVSGRTWPRDPFHRVGLEKWCINHPTLAQRTNSKAVSHNSNLKCAAKRRLVTARRSSGSHFKIWAGPGRKLSMLGGPKQPPPTAFLFGEHRRDHDPHSSKLLLQSPLEKVGGLRPPTFSPGLYGIDLWGLGPWMSPNPINL
jgi:hypothetical protein